MSFVFGSEEAKEVLSADNAQKAEDKEKRFADFRGKWLDIFNAENAILCKVDEVKEDITTLEERIDRLQDNNEDYQEEVQELNELQAELDKAKKEAEGVKNRVKVDFEEYKTISALVDSLDQ